MNSKNKKKGKFHQFLNVREKANEKHADFQMFYTDYCSIFQWVRKPWRPVKNLNFDMKLFLP